MADIHINDIDPAIWAFWSCVLHETGDLLDKIRSTPVTVSEWRKQRDIQRDEASTGLDLAFSTFFLNRTSRSGIIKDAGVIGGLDQGGPYKLDCRYNVDDLTRRIARIYKYKDRIHLTRMDALEFMDHISTNLPHRSFIFVDPPYYEKGAEFYTNFYNGDDHLEVARQVLSLERPWIVTYDDAPAIRLLYRSRRQYSFDVSYSVQEKRVGSELLIAAKRVKMPERLRARQVNRPQYR